MDDPIQPALAHAKKMLELLVQERTRIEREIVDWKRVVDSLSTVSEEPSDQLPADVNLGESPEISSALTIKFTDGIRNVLELAHGLITPPQIREQLANLGFDFSKYKQVLVPIHNTLKRLEEQGEVDSIQDTNGRIVGYQWVTPFERAMRQDDRRKKQRNSTQRIEDYNKLVSVAELAADPIQKLGKGARFPRVVPPFPSGISDPIEDAQRELLNKKK